MEKIFPVSGSNGERSTKEFVSSFRKGLKWKRWILWVREWRKNGREKGKRVKDYLLFTLLFTFVLDSRDVGGSVHVLHTGA